MAREKKMRNMMKDEAAADEGEKGIARDELMQLRSMYPATKAASGDSQEAKLIENSLPRKVPQNIF